MSGWASHHTAARLGDLCEIVIGRTPARAVPEYWGGDLPWVSIADIKAGVVVQTAERITRAGADRSRSRLLPCGTVLYSFKLTIGKVAVAGTDLYTNEAIAGLVIKDNTIVDRDFLVYALRVARPGDAASHAVMGMTLNVDGLRRLPVQLPPLREQRRVAARLTEQLAAVERARVGASMQVDAARSLNPAQLQRVFACAEARLWPRVPLGSVAEIVGGIQKSPARAPVRNHRPFLTVRNVQRGYLDLSVVERFEVTPREIERLRLRSGDVLVVEGNGSIDQIGRNALFLDDGQEWVHQNHVIRVRLDQRLCLPVFVSRYLNSREGWAQMVEKAQTTSGLYTLSAGKVADLEIPVPSLSVQRMVISAIDADAIHARAVLAAAEAELAAIAALPAALLREAFTA